jgi:hypothetical protein
MDICNQTVGGHDKSFAGWRLPDSRIIADADLQAWHGLHLRWKHCPKALDQAELTDVSNAQLVHRHASCRFRGPVLPHLEAPKRCWRSVVQPQEDRLSEQHEAKRGTEHGTYGHPRHGRALQM